MAPTYIYYSIFDTSGILNVKQPLPSEITDSDSKTIGRISKSRIVPPFNVDNVKLSISQQEGYQTILEADGAQLFIGSDKVTDANKLLEGEGVGLSLTNRLTLKFPRKLKSPQSDSDSDVTSRFVGKWQYISTGSNAKYHYKLVSYFTLKRTPKGNIVALGGYEHFTTTYTDFVGSDKLNDKPLPPRDITKLVLNEFKVTDSIISFKRSNPNNGVIWNMSGELSTDGKWLTITMKRVGLNQPPRARLFKRIVT